MMKASAQMNVQTAKSAPHGKKEKPGRITLLYHSGTGGTKLTAELLSELLSAENEIGVVNIQSADSAEMISGSDFLVFCFPTYYLKPSPSMTEFISRLPAGASLRKAYLVATAEIYSENCIRRCALSLKGKGFTVVGSAMFIAPGSDVTCVIPARFCRRLYRFEKRFAEKLRSVADSIRRLANEEQPKERIPVFKWYTPFTQLLQILLLNHFDKLKKRIRILSDRCVLCGKCVEECERGAWSRADGVLMHNSELCEFCTRCIHRCPKNAIVLLEFLKDNPRLDSKLYMRLGEETRKRLFSRLC